MSRGEDTNLYRYVGNNSTNYTDPTGTTLSGWADDALNAFDSFNAGFWNAATFGISTGLRKQFGGKFATQNLEGGFYDAGNIAGAVASFALGYGVEAQAARLAAGFVTGVRAYDVFGTTIGVVQGVQNFASGNGSAWDLINFAPVAGFATKNWRTIGGGLMKAGDAGADAALRLIRGNTLQPSVILANEGRLAAATRVPSEQSGNGFQHFLASIIDDRDGLVGKALSNREELLQELIQAGNKPLNEDKYANISDAIVKAMKEKNITLEQIPYLSSDLSRATKEYRLNNRNISKGRNVAAVKFKNKDGIDDIFIRPSDGLHSEIEILTDGGFLERIGGQGNFHNIDELYTELQPCNIQPSFCIKQLAIGNKNIPSGLSNANITYSFNYSDYPNALSGDKLRQLENKVKYAAFREDPDLGKVYWKGRRK